MKWFGNKGFSLIEVSVAMALVAGISLVVTELINLQNKSARSVASVMDRNDLHDRIRAMISNSDSCPVALGSKQSTPIDYTNIGGSTFPVGAIYDPSDNSAQPRVFVSVSQPPPGFTMKILSMSLKGTGVAPAPFGTNMIHYKKLTLTVEKVKDLASATNTNPAATPSYAVGGNAMKPIEIPIAVTVDSSNHIAGCSFDDGAGALPCGPGTTRVTTATGTKCQKVLCDSGSFPVGTDTAGPNKGNLHCCSLSEHFVGDVGGNPMCCPIGQFYDINTSSCAALNTLCTNPSMSKPYHRYYTERMQSKSADDVTCCRQVWAEDTGGSGTAQLWCDDGAHASLGYYVNTFGASCQASAQNLHGSKLLGDVNQLPVGAQVDCNSNTGAEVTASCCRQVKIPVVNTNPIPDCSLAPNPPNYSWDATAAGGAGACVFDPSKCVYPQTGYIGLNQKGTACQDCTTAGGGDSGTQCVFCPASKPWNGTACANPPPCTPPEFNCYNDITSAPCGCSVSTSCNSGCS